MNAEMVNEVARLQNAEGLSFLEALERVDPQVVEGVRRNVLYVIVYPHGLGNSTFHYSTREEAQGFIDLIESPELRNGCKIAVYTELAF